MKKILYIFIPISLIALISYAFFSNQTKESTRSTQEYKKASPVPQTLGMKPQESRALVNDLKKALVVRVIDGDTIEIEGGQKVRYIGIDTPEVVDPREPVQCFGKEASNKNKELVEGKEVSLEKDVSETDKYSRLLRYVYVGEIFVNDYLVRQGFAYSSSYPPDIKYQQQVVNAQEEARQENRGIWGICSGEVDTSASSNQPQTISGPNGCSIKGNISSKGEKIYHMPGQKYYDKTQINESKGEHWFCSEDEAIESGWRKSKI